MDRLTKGCARASVLWVLAVAGVASAAPSADAAPVIIDNPGGSGAAAGTGGGIAPPPDVRVVNAGAGIPVNGALLIYGGGTGGSPVIEVSDVATPGTTLGGTLTLFMSSWYWVWVPSAPFTEGATYQVRVSVPELGIFGLTETFDAIAAITIERPELMTAPSASWRSETNNWACCKSLFSGVLQDTTCFPSQLRASVILDPGLSTAEGAAFMNQFLFRMATGSAAAVTAPLSLWPDVFVSAIYDQADEYCFSLEAVDIVSGMVFTYEDIARCAPHGNLGALGLSDNAPGSAELDRLVCHAPPDQFKDAWCELNEDPCADDGMATACGLYGFVCEGEPLPPDPFAGMAGLGGASGFGGGGGFGAVGGAGAIGGEGGAAGMSDSGDGGESGMNEGGEGGDAAEMPSHGDGGCSISQVGAGRGSLELLTGAAALWLASRRRRARA